MGLGALWNRVKTWGPSAYVSSQDLNAEFDNVRNNSDAAHLGGYSESESMMQEQSSPGTVGNPSRASSISDELTRIRFVLARLLGKSYWYEAPSGSLESVLASSAFPSVRLVAGTTASGSGLSNFLAPAGTALSISVKAATTPLQYYVNGTLYTLTSDVTAAGLSAGPTTANTATLSAIPSGATNQTYGEDPDYPIALTSPGSAITARRNLLSAFKVTHSGVDDYFIGYVYSTDGTNYSLRYCLRGNTFDKDGANIPRVTLAAADTVTLLQLTWVFLNTSGQILVCYNNPIYGKKTPNSGATGDFWFDQDNQKWKQYTGTAWADASAILLGYCMQDGTACKAARSEEFFAISDPLLNIELEVLPNTPSTVSTRAPGMQVTVAGETFSADDVIWTWAAGASLDMEVGSGLSSTATQYYLYITDAGDRMISLTAPHDRPDLLGWYHPAKLWRCVASIWSLNGTNNFDGSTLLIYGASANRILRYNDLDGARVLKDGSIPFKKRKVRSVSSGSATVVGDGAVSSTAAATSVSSSGGLTDSTIANLNATLVTNGGPVLIAFVGDDTNGAYLSQGMNRGANGGAAATLDVYRDSTRIHRISFDIDFLTPSSTAYNTTFQLPLGALTTIDTGAAAGSHTYSVKVTTSSGATSGSTLTCYGKMVAIEL